VAQIELAKLLAQHHAVRDAEASVRAATATIGELSSIYLRGVDLDTSLKPATKQYRHKTIKYLFRSWADLENRIPAKVTEGECKDWAHRYHRRFSETSLLGNRTVLT
jgi:hypothetical protein